MDAEPKDTGAYLYCGECGSKNSVGTRFCEKCGKRISGAEDISAVSSTMATVRERIKAEIKEKIASKEVTINCAESLFPSEILLCEEETVVKTYHCAYLRTKFLMRTVAHGFLAITNKRVIYHTIPIKDNQNFMHGEALIEDVSGINLNKGKFFFPLILLANLLILSAGASVLRFVPIIVARILASIFSSGGIINPTVLSVCSSLCNLAFFGVVIFYIYRNFGSIKRRFPTIGIFFTWFFDFILGKRTALMFTVVSKGGASGPVNLSNLAVLKQSGGWDISAYPEPLENIQEITKEIGTIINDIQKTGGTSVA